MTLERHRGCLQASHAAHAAKDVEIARLRAALAAVESRLTQPVNRAILETIVRDIRRALED